MTLVLRVEPMLSWSGYAAKSSCSNLHHLLTDQCHKSIELYKKHSFQLKEQEGMSQESCLLQLRGDIEKVNKKSQEKLNVLLLDEFNSRLKIKYEEVQLIGKPKKRALTADDMAVLKPFHWGYHFDRVLARGGFDAIYSCLG